MRKKKNIYKNLKTINRSNKICQALILPKVLNINPRSIYNKKDEFLTFVKEEKVQLICISESWEKESLPLDKLIKMENFEVISNVSQRKGKGGRPAIIVDKTNYDVENITNTGGVVIPWGVEIVWAVLTPKDATNASTIQKIVVASVYNKPKSRKTEQLYLHIAEVYSLLSKKYRNGLHWLICGDTNDLKLGPILSLNLQLKQVVQNVTRLNPPRLLDPIITTLGKHYQVPNCLPPLDPDPGSNGKPSDHLMVLMSPISTVNNKPARMTKKIVYRPINESGLQKMNDWLEKEDWSIILDEESTNKKAETLQNMLLDKFKECFPEKHKVISSDDQPFINEYLKKLKRKKCCEYHKHRKSRKWVCLEEKYQKELANAKSAYYRKKIKKLRKTDPRKWYEALKKLTRYDQHKKEEIVVESIKDLPDKKQAELIADNFSEISLEYDSLRAEDINIPDFGENDIPQFTTKEVESVMKEMDPNKSNVTGDIPAKILKKFACFLALPISNVINSSIREGVWPDICKLEIVTPVPKQFPPKEIDHLRNISGLLNLDKIAEKLITRLIISDMKQNLDPSQYANQKGISIQHYLIKFIDRILLALEKKESRAVLATMVDWKQAFSRQCPKLGIESFIKNGVRPALIPTLISYFQGRKMKVKWHGQMSTTRELKGGGPQGSSFGIWEYLSQSNDNADSVEVEDRFKFVDDLSFIEVIYLLNVGLASYNIQAHVPSDIPEHNQIIPNEHLESQKHLSKINEWTKAKKMKLNEKKTKNMVFNFSQKQFVTKMVVNNEKIETVKETMLLGTVITDNLTWDRNCEELTKKAYKRMQLLNCVASFTKSRQDLKHVYLTFIRSVLEQSAVVWHSSLTEKNKKDLERVQKVAVKIIMGTKFLSYKEGLRTLNIQSLDTRRTNLCLRFAKNCLKNEKMKDLFPVKKYALKMKIRRQKKFRTKKYRTARMKKSSLPYMRALLNEENEKKVSFIKNSMK